MLFSSNITVHKLWRHVQCLITFRWFQIRWFVKQRT